jgi:GNAT superfamily N-acetyltransferase
VGGEPEIRIATPGDAEALRALVLGFRDHLVASAPTEADLARLLPPALSDPSLEFVLALSPDGEGLGYAQTRFFATIWSAAGTDAYLEDIFVVARARGAGLGLALLEFAVARAAERGAGAISLQTNERNASALRLYTRAGFAPSSEAIFPGGREIGLVRRLGPDPRPPLP